jgi:transcriptional regulator with XRE-family HTH domain
MDLLYHRSKYQRMKGGWVPKTPRLREWRERAALSQSELANRAGISRATIADLEAGNRGGQPKTVRRLAQGLGVEPDDLYGEAYPKEPAPPDPQQSFDGLLEEEWRAQHLGVWKTYLSRRAEWCEKVLQKRPEDDWNNPFQSLDTAIQWAIYIGIESAHIRNTIQTEVLPYADADPELVDELRTLLNRLSTVDEKTNSTVKKMMDKAGLNKEDMEKRLRLIHGSAA